MSEGPPTLPKMMRNALLQPENHRTDEAPWGQWTANGWTGVDQAPLIRAMKPQYLQQTSWGELSDSSLARDVIYIIK